MPFLRYTIDLAIPLDADGKLRADLDKRFSEIFTSAKLNNIANENFIEGVEAVIEKLKEYAVKINEGSNREEATIKAVKHICKHDVGLPCDTEVEVSHTLHLAPPSIPPDVLNPSVG